MVDLYQLTLDSTELVSYLALPFLAVAAFFLLAWDRTLGGEAIGFGKRTFLLVLVGGFVGYIANLPILALNGSVMMINVGGALIPIAVSLAVLGDRLLPGRLRELVALIAALAIATTLAVATTAYANANLAVVLVVVALVVGALAFVALRRPLSVPAGVSPVPALLSYALVGLGIVVTFVTTQVIFGVGIVSNFPDYVVFPAAAGALAVVARWPQRDAPALAYATSTLGVLIGADVLHQPQLYTGGTFLGAIGGAGPEDLVFLSGPMALLTALVLQEGFRWLRKSPEPAAPADPSPLWGIAAPSTQFQAAIRKYAEKAFDEVPRLVLETLAEDVRRLRIGLGLPSAPSPFAMEGVPAHPLLRADLENLQRLSTATPVDVANARRALITGFLVQRGLLEIQKKRLGELGARVEAFLADCLLVAAPSLPLLYLSLRLTHVESVDAADTSVAFNAMLSALAAWPFAFFTLSEYWWGTTPGKHWMHLRVVGPDGGRPPFLGVVARNMTKLVAYLAIVTGIAEAVLLLLYSPGSTVLAVVFIGLGFVAAGVPDLVGMMAIRSSPRGQRLGDRLGGTYVWHQAPPWSPYGPWGAPLGAPAAPVTPAWTPPTGATGPWRPA